MFLRSGTLGTITAQDPCLRLRTWVLLGAFHIALADGSSNQEPVLKHVAIVGGGAFVLFGGIMIAKVAAKCLSQEKKDEAPPPSSIKITPSEPVECKEPDPTADNACAEIKIVIEQPADTPSVEVSDQPPNSPSARSENPSENPSARSENSVAAGLEETKNVSPSKSKKKRLSTGGSTPKKALSPKNDGKEKDTEKESKESKEKKEKKEKVSDGTRKTGK